MKENKCCDCGCVMEQSDPGVEFVKFTEARTPLYRKLYAFFCPRCGEYRQVEDDRVA